MRVVATVVASTGLALLAACQGGDGASSDSAAARRSAPSSTVAPVTTTAPVTSPDQLTAPTTATAVAAELVRTERALRSDAATALPADVAPIVRANHAAAVHLEGPSLGPIPTELPDWTIRTPLPASTLLGFYREAEVASGVPWQYLAAIHLVETRVGRIHGNSGAGARGPMQFVASTWAAYGEGGDVDDDHDAILAAGRYLAAAGAARDIGRALFAYNHSDDYVAAIEVYAGVMAADARAYDGYHAWQVYVTTTSGTRRLPEGWTRP
jgi:hypothetical protein